MNIIEVMNSHQIDVGYAMRPSWGDGVILVRSNISNISKNNKPSLFVKSIFFIIEKSTTII